MSRRGNCFDNAPIESLWDTLKSELVYHRRFVTREGGTLCHLDAFALQLPPHFAYPVHAEILFPYVPDGFAQYGVTPGPWRKLSRLSTPGRMCVIRRRSNRQHSAGWLGPVQRPMTVDEGHLQWAS
ncbi:hypothetical protein LMG29542_08106 [Paraburkholderia humisilvae]|uniref:Integrase catalytic domain-containing protein n=1 Tax=Paraburkholderia humisilvae TaxID=627669 RepID=A0A6J5F742_9BURK|nr:hypothetical protein LMG29542_08106 [Paraburkholderia humisilvae]